MRQYRFLFFLLILGTSFFVACGARNQTLPIAASGQDQASAQQYSLPVPSGAPIPPDAAQRSLRDHLDSVNQLGMRRTQSAQPAASCPPGMFGGWNYCFTLTEGQGTSISLTGSDAELQTCGYNAVWDVNYGSDSHISRTFNPLSEPANPIFITTASFIALPGSGGLKGGLYGVGLDWITTGFCIFKPYYDSPATQWALITVPAYPQPFIAAEAEKWINQSDQAFADGQHANCKNGCLVTVNGLVYIATGKFLGGEANVTNLDDLRTNGDVTQIAQKNAVPGDFLIVDSVNKLYAHIGICRNVGCTNVISNSSTHCTFTFESDNDARFAYPTSPYNGGIATYWRAVLK